MDICKAESLHYSPETITTLLISYTAIQNKAFTKNRKEFRRPRTYPGKMLPQKNPVKTQAFTLG